MYSRDCLERKLDSLLCRQIMNIFRGCGKTQSIINLAKQDIEEGKKVCIVTNHTYIMKNEVANGLNADIIHIDELIKCLNNITKLAKNYVDVGSVDRKLIPIFKDYDYVLMDPAIYEDIIITLMDKLDRVTKEAKKWS